MLYESTPGLPFLTGFLVLVSLFIAWYRRVDPLLDAVPTVGFSDPILSYLSAFRYNLLNGALMLKEGYEKTKPGLFKIATFRRWIVVPSGTEMIEEVLKAPDSALSARGPLLDFLQIKYTLSFLNMDDMYHRSVVLSKVTRMAAIFDQIHDELVGAFDDFIPTTGQEWVKVSTMPAMQRIVCQTSSRVAVGAPLYRDHDYQTLVISFIENFMISVLIISCFPKFLKPMAARFFSRIPSHVRQTMEFIRFIVEERSAKMKEFGENWDDAPNDMLMWLMSEAKGVERSLEGWTRRLLILNFASINATSVMLTQTLYRLLAHPEYIEPLRQEVEAVVAEEGWTKAGMDKMHKIDSFVRETQRIDTPMFLGLNRLALRPFTFSNGVTIPAGTLIGLPDHSVHTDEEIYPNAQEFDGFRFLKLREKEGDDVLAARHQMATTSVELLSFEYGRNACPGRLLAANEVKALLAHILVTYDIKFEEGKGVPRELRFGSFRAPGNANILFRKRQK
ncbi:cytochrome P450 [Russula ochroleuca]|uniref:Cytochrome P450 n=1 Tax=Russula ochroleuca TaxID=152965 RepID=A0A9P5MMM6_9AGAM|nr:cytochrome P450 [Russula ochroleuca]